MADSYFEISPGSAPVELLFVYPSFLTIRMVGGGIQLILLLIRTQRYNA